MDKTTPVDHAPARPQHKRTTSSVLKSMMPKNHQRKPSSKTPFLVNADDSDGASLQGNSMLPPEHPHTRQHFREDSGNRNNISASPMKSMDGRKEKRGSCKENGMPKSKSFMAMPEKEKVKSPKKKLERQEEQQMKNSKSSTGLSALLSRPRSLKSSKAEETHGQNDKENQAPPSSASTAPPPIWAQFATQDLQQAPGTTKVTLNDRRSIEKEAAKYTPQVYSPSKQRQFRGDEQPTLSQRPGMKPRPKSECITPKATPASFAETISGLRRSSRDTSRANILEQMPQATRAVGADFNSTSSGGDAIETREINKDSSRSGMTTAKRGSRVMAAVAAFNGTAKELPKEPSKGATDPVVDPKEIETAFETLLEARNVPQNTRDKMRTLDTNIKADFINKDKFGSGSASSTEGLALQSSRPSSGKHSQTDDNVPNAAEGLETTASIESPKKSRPRSRTFTFSKGDQSPWKKQKPERPVSHHRTKSGELAPSESSTSLTATGAQMSGFFSRNNKPALPEDYIGYLKKVQKPEHVEVGKIHKLRQLLRNETVGWVETFIAQGGMTELVGLLYRTIKVEWREEHEDQLLHETLRCLKGLSTTSSALHQLSQTQSTLFPALLAMLFDKEKKGPSEFSTRSIIISLLHTYLADSKSSDLAIRARSLLSYLRDPDTPEESLPPGFIASIYHPRPYRVWNKEIDNVIKEVFWIFLHHVNIIPYPPIPETASTYTERHFPREHPPVPAAPYIGGVEWDATNYLTAHIDLLNGIIASLPTTEERNNLRQELKDSGFEKVMAVSLRTCKEKFYGCVHEALATWVGAAKEDDWPYQDVRQGPKPEDRRMVSPKKSPKKKDQAPQLEMPKLDLGGGGGVGGGMGGHGGWL